MYHVAGTSLILTVFYLFSLLLGRTGFYDIQVHRKIWNAVLAASFLFVALAGVFMALQINYKWNVPLIKTLLKWHVEAGVACTLTGLFHLTWHLSYFKGFFRQAKKEITETVNHETADGDRISSSLLLIGFVSTSVQVLLAREILIIAGGYELIAGVFFGTWLVTSAAGVFAAGKSPMVHMKKISIFFAAAPFISLIFLLVLSRFFAGTGETPSFLISMLLCFAVLLPFCFVSGFAFVKLVNEAKMGTKRTAGGSYSIETAGGFLAGFLVTVLTSGSFNTYKLLLVISLLSLAFTLLVYIFSGKKQKFAVKLAFTILIAAIIIGDPDLFFRKMLMPGAGVKSTTDTPYGNITHGNYAGQDVTYYNQRLLSYENDVMESEEEIHFAMLQRTEHRNVTVISGNAASLIPELEKYKPGKITFIERDPALLATMKIDMVTQPGNIVLSNEDAWNFIRKNHEKADAVILLVPPPSTLSLNRFYSLGFIRNVKKTLTHDGVFICSPAPGENYLNGDAVALCSTVFNTLQEVFTNVVPVAGHRLWFLASDEKLSVDFCKLTTEQNIKNRYVGPDYFSDDITEAKTAEIMRTMDRKVKINKASFPLAVMKFQFFNLSRNLAEKTPAIILILLAFVLPLAAVRKENIPMCLAAAALSGFEIITLLAVQLSAGNMYMMTGLTLALFMAGLSAGAGINPGRLNLKTAYISLLVFYCLAALFIIPLTETGSGKLAGGIILAASLVPSFLTGNIFRNITNNNKEPYSVSGTYGSDLLGSALGFLAVSAILVPVLGISVSLLALAVLIVVAFLFALAVHR